MGNPPEMSFSSGTIRASVFVKEIERDNGQIAEVRNVSFTKSYKEGKEWKNTSSLNVNDIPKAIVVLQQAYEHIVLSEG